MHPLNIFTDQEVESLKQLRESVRDLELTNDDYFYIKWLRARDLNVKAAEEMLRNSMRWRKENDIENVLTWQPPEEFGREFAYDMDGFDKDGCPLLTVPYGKFDIRKAVANGQRDVYLRYFDQLCERALHKLAQLNKSRPANDPLTQIFIIWDLEGFSLRQITARGTVDAILEGVKRMEANYPELLKCSWGVNSPRVFALLFAIIKPVLTPRTLEKVQIFGCNSNKWKSELLKRIPTDQLLPAYGGTRSPSKEFAAVNSKFHPKGEDGTLDADELCVVTIDSGDTLNIALDVKHPNSTLNWKFRTDDFDVGFALYWNEEQLLNEDRVDSHINKQEGSWACTKAGRYTLAFDNTYSLVRAKTLHYMVTVTSPEDDDDQIY